MAAPSGRSARLRCGDAALASTASHRQRPVAGGGGRRTTALARDAPPSTPAPRAGGRAGPDVRCSQPLVKPGLGERAPARGERRAPIGRSRPAGRGRSIGVVHDLVPREEAPLALRAPPPAALDARPPSPDPLSAAQYSFARSCARRRRGGCVGQPAGSFMLGDDAARAPRRSGWMRWRSGAREHRAGGRGGNGAAPAAAGGRGPRTFGACALGRAKALAALLRRACACCCCCSGLGAGAGVAAASPRRPRVLVRRLLCAGSSRLVPLGRPSSQHGRPSTARGRRRAASHGVRCVSREAAARPGHRGGVMTSSTSRGGWARGGRSGGRAAPKPQKLACAARTGTAGRRDGFTVAAGGRRGQACGAVRCAALRCVALRCVAAVAATGGSRC